MPPNVKEVASVAESLSNVDLSALVKPEFLPLTDPRELQTTSPSKSNEFSSQISLKDSADYWTWPASIEAEEARELTSADHIEANLVEESKQHITISVEIESADSVEGDAYWTWSSEPDTMVEVSLPQHVSIFSASNVIYDPALNDFKVANEHPSYWVFPAETEECSRFDAALTAREARRLTSVAYMEQKLRLDRPSTSIPDHYWQWSGGDETVTASDAYWSWESNVSHRGLAISPDYWDC